MVRAIIRIKVMREASKKGTKSKPVVTRIIMSVQVKKAIKGD